MSSEENLREEYRHGFGDLPDDILIERGEVQSGELYRPVSPNVAPDVRSAADMVSQNTGENLIAYPLKVSSVFDTLPINAQPFLSAGNMVKVYDPAGAYTWLIQATPANADNDWASIAWSPELGLFAAVAITGVGNRVMTSPDGVNWTIQVSAADNDWNAIAWSPELGLFVAVAGSGVGNRVMTSPDGVNWTIRASAANNVWNAITWSPEFRLFMATALTGIDNEIMSSTDGINWTSRVNAANNGWTGIAWSPELRLFVTVAENGVGNRAMTSSILADLLFVYTIPDNYIGILKNFKLNIDNIIIGAGNNNYLFSLLINNSVVPNMNSIPYKQLFGDNILSNVIVASNATLTLKLNVNNTTFLPNGNISLQGILLLSRGYPPNYEIGSE